MSEDLHTTTPAEFWEDRYSSSDRVWSGQVNSTLVELASEFPPGRSLDLGCGEGADVIWLASRGWDATGVDLSETATVRARAAAVSAGIPGDRIRFVATDLSAWESTENYDLVTATFFHSWPIEVPRTAILRKVAQSVVPGGRLLIISHSAPPPWADSEHVHDYKFLTPEDEIEELGLDEAEWKVELAEIRSRETTAPNGEAASIDDAVVMLTRRT